METHIVPRGMIVKSRDYGSIITMSISDRTTRDNRLGSWLRDRRARIDPAAFGLPPTRRRTPGLRREEVAQRARISPTWYACLEQGRGGAPSADALDRIAQALMLTDIEREHLFLLGLGRPAEVRYKKREGVTPRLQHVLDALDPTPALIKTATWDVVAWNRAVAIILADYGSLPPEERNMLRHLFLSPQARAAHYDWKSVARAIVAAFRVDVARAGAAAEVGALVDDLRRLSPEFEAMWRDNDVGALPGEMVKHIRHPILGDIAFEYSTFAIDGRPDLSMAVYNPATPADAAGIKSLIDAPPACAVSARATPA
jgi:transcriptional regulator with XRE-family HTH domain